MGKIRQPLVVCADRLGAELPAPDGDHGAGFNVEQGQVEGTNPVFIFK